MRAYLAASFAMLAIIAVSVFGLAFATPCPTEDSYNCTWAGGSNGVGSHFVTLGTEEAYVTIPLP